MFDNHKNFAYSQVQNPPTPPLSGGSLTVLSGQGSQFPSPPFNATIWAPNSVPTSTNATIVRVTKISGDTLSFTRQQEGSNNRAIQTYDSIAAGITVKTITDIEDSTANTVVTVGTSNADYITTGTADNIQIQAAIDSLSSNGGTVFIQAGTYTLAASITLASNGVIIQGEGNATRINFPGNTVATAFKMADTTQRSFIQINNLKINSTSTGKGLALDMSHFAICSSRNLIITGCNQGIDINSNDAFYNYIENPRIAVSGSGSFGIRIQNGANENTIMRARIGTDANSTGVMINGAHSNELYSVDVETGALFGIDIQANAHYTLITACYLESNQTNLNIAANVRALQVTGGTIISGTTANITDAGASGVNFIGVNNNFSATLNQIGGAGSSELIVRGGNTSAEVIRLDMDQPTSGAASQRDSHYLTFRGTSWDGAIGHNTDYQMYVNVTASGSQMFWKSREDNASFATKMTLGGNGLLTLTNALIMPSNPPATSSSAGATGQIAWDSGFLYICVAANTWQRVATVSW